MEALHDVVKAGKARYINKILEIKELLNIYQVEPDTLLKDIWFRTRSLLMDGNYVRTLFQLEPVGHYSIRE
ncbi:hypothetical protein SB775_17935 [Peribacillus sp. SIMBA_075]|uniref:hypothetical protein n=1 Tax=Peribacillus sp. SIMBA_075 TaxID=3085813 RepID=UPI00397CB573